MFERHENALARLVDRIINAGEGHISQKTDTESSEESFEAFISQYFAESIVNA